MNTPHKFEIIPAIDIINGQLVRLTQGDYKQVETYTETPLSMAKLYEENGAKRIHIVDLDGAKDGKIQNIALLKKIRKETNCQLEFGGGIRSKETVQELIDSGIDYIILGSLLITNPKKALEIIHAYPNKIIAGIDAKGQNVATEGWIKTSDTTTQSLIETLNNTPIAAIIYTDIEKDGTLSGPNISALKDLCTLTDIPIIASGGVANKADIHRLKSLSSEGLSGCVVGKAILNGNIPLNQVWHE